MKVAYRTTVRGTWARLRSPAPMGRGGFKAVGFGRKRPSFIVGQVGRGGMVERRIQSPCRKQASAHLPARRREGSGAMKDRLALSARGIERMCAVLGGCPVRIDDACGAPSPRSV